MSLNNTSLLTSGNDAPKLSKEDKTAAGQQSLSRRRPKEVLWTREALDYLLASR